MAGGFAERMGVFPLVRAELRAVLRRLVIAKEKGFRKLIINMDSSVVVDMLQGNEQHNARYEAIVQRCKNLFGSSEWEVAILHCFREVNRVADALANIGVDLTDDYTFFVHPLGVVCTLLLSLIHI